MGFQVGLGGLQPKAPDTIMMLSPFLSDVVQTCFDGFKYRAWRWMLEFRACEVLLSKAG